METPMVVILLSVQMIYPNIQINLNNSLVHLRILPEHQDVQSRKYVLHDGGVATLPLPPRCLWASYCVGWPSPLVCPPLPVNVHPHVPPLTVR